MPKTHTVQQGECLSSIADRYGFADWRTIYDHPDNVGLREERADPNVLYPGDFITIPDKESRSVSVAAGQKHVFRLRSRQPRLRITLLDAFGDPYAGRDYRLEVAGSVVEGKVPNDGLIDLKIPPDARTARLEVAPDGADDRQPVEWTLQLGRLDPVARVTGYQARLNNLGYPCGKVDGIDGPLTKAAARAFQADHDLVVDGIVGPKTKAKLLEVYGC